MKSRRMSSLAGQVGLVVLLGAVLGFGGFLLFDGSQSKLTCTECGQHMAAWQQGNAPSGDVQQAIEDHLADCPGCRKRYREALQRLLTNLPLPRAWRAALLAEHVWSQSE